MTLTELQALLKASGRYAGAVDGLWGRLTEAAILLALTDGPDTALSDEDFARMGAELEIQPAAIKAFWKTEASGAGFFRGLPKILPEPHRFSKATRGRFDRQYPDISYPRWGMRPYPASQDARYDVLLRMVRLDVDAGFGSVSYGAPQILGENHRSCNYPSAFAFAEAMARDEQTQLRAFASFIAADGILPHLRRVDRTVASWRPVAQRYNGTAYRKNRYDEKMATNFIAFGGR